MKKRFEVKEKNEEPTTSTSVPNCCHRYVLVKTKYSMKLVCRLCDQFYGYVKDERDARLYSAIERKHGGIDMSRIEWERTEYTNRSDDLRTKRSRG